MILTAGTYLGQEAQQRHVPGFTLSLTRYHAGQALPVHCHEAPYLSLALKGTYHEQPNAAMPGQVADHTRVLLRPAGYEHANTFGRGQGACFNIELTGQAAHNEVLPAHWAQSFCVLPNNWAVTTVVNAFVQQYEADLLACLAHEALLALCQTTGSVRCSKPVHKALGYLRDTYNQPFSLKVLAHEVGLHPAYLARAFKAATGLAIGDYLRQLRLQHAFYDLPQQHSLTQLALAHGFYDQAHFSKTCKQYFGIAPRQLKKHLNRLT